MTTPPNESTTRTHRRWRSVLDLVTTIAMLSAAVLLIWTNYPKIVTSAPRSVLPAEPLALNDALTEGLAAAKVGMVMFSEFQCPFCVKFSQQTLPGLREKYVNTGVLKIAFRHLPLEGKHDKAFAAAEAVECANDQGRWVPMHDALFAEPKSLSPDSFQDRAEALQLDAAAFRSCLKTGRASKVRADIATAQKLGVTATPTFLIGRLASDGRLVATKRINGARPLEHFVSVVDEVLASR